MKRLFAFFLVLICLSVCAYCAETADGTEYTPTIFFGFDDGKVPSAFKPKDLVILSGQTDYVVDGIFSATTKTGDPYITYTTDFNFDDYSEFKIRMKHKTTDASAVKCNLQIFFAGTKADGTAFSFNGTDSIYQRITLDSGDVFKEYTLNFSTLTALAGAHISSVRIDMVSVIGEVYIDYVMFVPVNANKDILYTFDAGLSPWGKGSVTITENNGIISGVTTSTSGIITNGKHRFLGADYPKAYVHMMIDKEVAEGATGDDAVPGIPTGEEKYSLFYTNLVDAEGTTVKPLYEQYEGYKHASATIKAADNQKYKLYTYDFSQYEPYLNNYITSMSFNVIQATGLRFNVDTILFKNPKSYSWNFECGEFLEGWTASDTCFKVEDGLLKYTEIDTVYSNPRIELSGLNIVADNYVGFEIVMKHKLLEGEDSNFQLYYAGTDINGNAIKISENATVRVQFNSVSSGENFIHYYLDLSNANSWKGSTITKLRLDPINSLGNVEIQSMRLIPAKHMSEPLDGENMELSYEFEDNKAGTADGVVTLDFGEQDSKNATSVALYWASKNEDGEYEKLSDYSVIKVLDGEEIEAGYKIDKNLVIPDDADAIITKVKDCVKSFDVAFDIPESKKAPVRGEPIFTVGLISDIHVGGWESETSPNVRLVAAKDQLSELCDFVVVNGDLTQWYGAYSGEEFKAYNYDGSKYADNGETSPEYLGIGKSQWAVLTDYFKSFSVPVYAVQGNHDIRDSAGWSEMIESEKYLRPFLEEWVSYSNTAQNGSKYENTVALNDGVNYYDTEINGYHFIFTSIPKTASPCYSFGEEQLKWLDMKLYEKETSGKPIFVFGHVPLETNLNGSYWDDQIGDDAAIKEILAKHPTAIYVSGHTHYSLDVDYLSSIDGAQNTPSYVHDGGTTTINVPKDEANPDVTTEISGSHGVVAKVYEDGILLCGRDFVSDIWVSRGYTYLTFKDACEIDEIAVEKTFSPDGFTLTANAPENASVTWIVDGETVEGSETALTLASDFDGSVAVRYTDENGNYRSEVIENISEIPFGDIFEANRTVSIRISEEDKTSGLRFITPISNVSRDAVTEYGYIVTRKTFLDNYGAELTFDFKNENGTPLFVSGANHVKNEDGTLAVDKVFETLEDSVRFSCVITGLDMTNAMQVCETMVARCYAKIVVDGKEIVVYSTPMSGSLQKTAEFFRNNSAEFGEFYEANKEFINSLADMSVEN